MYEVQLTNLQKLYLLNLADNSSKITITQFSEVFECSKANSKSILDRMVKLGVLYKDKKTYLFTILGKNITQSLVEERNKIELVLSTMFSTSYEKSKEYANSLVSHGIDEFISLLSSFYEHCNHNYTRGEKIDYKKLENILKKGEHNIYFCIYKVFSDKISHNGEFSMANSGFDSKAKLIIGEDSHILLDTKSVKKSDKGFLKKAILLNISQNTNKGNIMMKAEAGQIRIPLNILNEWYFIDKNTVQSGIYLNTHTNIGFIEHNKVSLFIFTINFLNL